MYKYLVKQIKYIINDIEGYDYMAKVKYVVYLLCLELFKVHNNTNDMAFFKEYSKFDLNDKKAEKAIVALVAKDVGNIDFSSLYPASLYEELLTQKEIKLLGQVYTPFDIIGNMLTSVFKIKTIDGSFKILDPSCGGGYFLIELYKYISKTYPEIGNRHIIESMLYGIDIDNFSIFLTKMGLVFHSNLSNLKFNILNADFLIDKLDDLDDLDKLDALDDVNNLNGGKFDLIIGNPPYVGHKNTRPYYRKILAENYPDVYYEKADISYCFFRKAKDMLKNDGIVSFISSRYFMEALYADRLRKFIKENFNIISLVDYNGDRAFKRAMISPAIITLSNSWNKNIFTYVKKTRDIFESYKYRQDKLKDSGWIILKDEDEKLFEKIHSISNTNIKDICTIKQGIITGYDKAFIVTEELIEKYNIESFLLKKWIKNSNISRSTIKYNNLSLIYSDVIEDEKQFPNAISYLTQYKDILMKRRECAKGFRKWYELQWGRNKSDYENPKIIFPYKAKENNFHYDKDGYFSSADVYLMNDFSKNLPLNYLRAYLNSEIFEFYLKCQVKKVGRDVYEYYPNKLNNLKIYLPQENNPQVFSQLGKFSIEIFLQKLFNIDEREVSIYKDYLKRR